MNDISDLKYDLADILCRMLRVNVESVLSEQQEQAVTPIVDAITKAIHDEVESYLDSNELGTRDTKHLLSIIKQLN